MFNRSYYEGLISDPLEGLCRENELPGRLQRLLAFEADLVERRTRLLKCYLQISRAEQKLRLQQRLTHPHKRWKLGPGDLLAYRQYDLREQRWSALLSASHSEQAPWYVIPAEHRWLRDWLLASLLARAFEQWHLQWPDRPAPFSLAELEQSYPPPVSGRR